LPFLDVRPSVHNPAAAVLPAQEINSPSFTEGNMSKEIMKILSLPVVIFIIIIKSRDTAVAIAMDYGLDGQGWVPGRGMFLSFS
jgi:hypothetical protein